jgi:NaMN:DMB phosphoribosyltransferase
VKEGVAAGALMALAHLAGKSEEAIREAIDSQYELMVQRQ